jgi:hypothetical protein
MNAYQRGLQALERLNEPELAAAYQAYVQRLGQHLSSDEMDLYAAYIQRLQLASAPRPEEQAVADKIAGDGELDRLYQHYLQVLNKSQQEGGVGVQPGSPQRARR